MAEVPAGAPLSVAAPDRDVLLATKLHTPGPPPGFVPRTRLAAALDEGLARGLILVCAPAGAGKTALLAEWARRGDRPVGWLSLDAGDNDPARFWRHVVAALDGARPGIGERVGPLLGPPAPPSFDGLLTALVNELTSQSGEAVLVLDDYHLIDATQVHTSLAFLLEHLPPCLYLVLASRSDPPLPVARLRAGGQLAELRAGELRFTAEEAAALLCGATGADLPAAEVTALAARTEGWAAGLQLAGLSLRGQADPSGFVAAFSGTHRYVLDYLTEEVLERQPDPLRVFLLETSVLERLSGGLCDAVTGRAGGQAMLDQVERAGLFLMPLCRQFVSTPPLATGLATLAWIRQAQGDAAGALEAIGEAEQAALGPAVPGLLNPVPAQRARLLLAHGDIAAAARWTQERDLGVGDEPDYPREPEYLVLARVQLAQNQPGPALALLERLRAAATAHGRTGSVIEIQALQALALAAAGDDNAAVDTLAAALTLACPQGYVRVFADEGPPMHALLTRLVAAQKADHAAACGVPLDCLARLLGAFGERPPARAGRGATAAVPGLAEQLTARELDVLRLLAAGAPNPRIAAELVVTLDTVKKHVSHLLGKLGAVNRTEAVTRARQLGLIT